MMKQFYEIPEMEVIRFDEEDIITLSGDADMPNPDDGTDFPNSSGAGTNIS